MKEVDVEVTKPDQVTSKRTIKKQTPKQGRIGSTKGVSLKTKVPRGRLTFEMRTNVSWPEFIRKNNPTYVVLFISLLA